MKIDPDGLENNYFKNKKRRFTPTRNYTNYKQIKETSKSVSFSAVLNETIRKNPKKQ